MHGSHLRVQYDRRQKINYKIKSENRKVIETFQCSHVHTNGLTLFVLLIGATTENIEN